MKNEICNVIHWHHMTNSTGNNLVSFNFLNIGERKYLESIIQGDSKSNNKRCRVIMNIYI